MGLKEWRGRLSVWQYALVSIVGLAILAGFLLFMVGLFGKRTPSPY